jgi:hypothetical protein
MTCTLFAIMHRKAAMAGPECTAIAVAAALLMLFTRQFVLAWSLGAWSLLHPAVLAFGNLPAVASLIVATLLCKNGDSVMHTLADMAMSNPFTGRRA